MASADLIAEIRKKAIADPEAAPDG